MHAVRPGGYVVCSLRRDIYEASVFQEKHADLKEAGKAEVIEAAGPRLLMPIDEPGLEHQVWVLKVM